MTETTPKPYVRTDDQGVMRVGDTRVSLASVVYAFRAGDSAEGIQRAYRTLELEEVYGAIAYYLAHTKEVDDHIREREQIAEQWRAKAEANRPPVVDRLRALLQQRQQQQKT